MANTVDTPVGLEQLVKQGVLPFAGTQPKAPNTPWHVIHMAYYRPQTSRRQAELQPRQAALLFIDVQNYNCSKQGALYQALTEEQRQVGRRAASRRPEAPRHLGTVPGLVTLPAVPLPRAGTLCLVLSRACLLVGRVLASTTLPPPSAAERGAALLPEQSRQRVPAQLAGATSHLQVGQLV